MRTGESFFFVTLSVRPPLERALFSVFQEIFHEIQERSSVGGERRPPMARRGDHSWSRTIDAEIAVAEPGGQEGSAVPCSCHGSPPSNMFTDEGQEALNKLCADEFLEAEHLGRPNASFSRRKPITLRGWQVLQGNSQ